MPSTPPSHTSAPQVVAEAERIVRRTSKGTIDQKLRRSTSLAESFRQGRTADCLSEPEPQQVLDFGASCFFERRRSLPDGQGDRSTAAAASLRQPGTTDGFAKEPFAQPRRGSVSSLSSSASDGMLTVPKLPPIKTKKQDPWAMVLHTRKCGKLYREDLHAVLDVYQTMDEGMPFSSSRYHEASASPHGNLALQLIYSFKVQRVDSGKPLQSRKLQPGQPRTRFAISFEDFLMLIWPDLSESELQVMLTWAKQRHAQSISSLRAKGAKRLPQPLPLYSAPYLD